MKVDKDGLAKVLARLKAEADAKPKQKARAKPESRVDLALLNNLKEIRPKLVHELAERMGKSRQGIYYMIWSENYGGTKPAREAIDRLNAVLKDLLTEVRDSVNNAARK